MRLLLSANAAWNLANFRAGLIAALTRAGHEVVAAAPPDRGVGRLEALGARFVPLAMDSKGMDPVRDLGLLARYLRLFAAERPDAFLGWTVKPNVYGTLAARRHRVPAINNVSGLGTAFIREGLLTTVVAALYRAAFARSAAVFFQNGDDRALFLARRIVAADRTAVLPGSGVDLSRFAAAARPGADGATFLLVARLLRDKGIVEYVEAARLLRRRHPAARFQLLGVQDAPNRTAIPRADVAAWVAEGVVEYLGATDDVRPFIAAADCVVLPSYREGTPRTLLEAAAMGTPLVATDVPGCREVVADGRNGFLCRARDGADLARALDAFLSLGGPARAAMGRESRRLVEARFDETIVIAAYERAIAGAAAAPPVRAGAAC